MNTKNIAVITSSVGAIPPQPADRWNDIVDYHAYVSIDLVGIDLGWEIHEVTEFSNVDAYTNRRNAKIYKAIPQLFLPGYDYYIWIDSTVSIKMNPLEIIDSYLKDSDIALFKHPERDCSYDEIDTVSMVGIDHPVTIQSTKAYLESRKFKRNRGLYGLTSRIQRNTPQMLQMGLMWWELICRFSSRDQLTLPYVCDTLGIKPSILPGNCIGDNPVFPLVKQSNHPRTIKKIYDNLR